MPLNKEIKPVNNYLFADNYISSIPNIPLDAD